MSVPSERQMVADLTYAIRALREEIGSSAIEQDGMEAYVEGILVSLGYTAAEAIAVVRSPAVLTRAQQRRLPPWRPL